jgi:predicted flap endonuclease-1-like 5' DNA nuclease
MGSVRPLKSIEGIGDAQAEKLRAAGIRGFSSLLARASTARARRKLAVETGISDELILDWYNRADSQRIKGIGTEMADLLRAAAVDGVKDLAQCDADDLHKQLMEVNARTRLVRRAPTVGQVRCWVAEARQLALDPPVSHLTRITGMVRSPSQVNVSGNKYLYLFDNPPEKD